MTTRPLTAKERKALYDGYGAGWDITCAGDLGSGPCGSTFEWRYDTIRCAQGHVIEMALSDLDLDYEEESDE